jgi:alpha-galactosidase/6-phospho-beta-glucosidase family protein
LNAGDELFAFYGYKPGPFPSDFLWYWETKREVERQERLEREEQERLEREEQERLEKEKRLKEAEAETNKESKKKKKKKKVGKTKMTNV